MERIIRLNAVKNLWQPDILGMKQHSLHPNENLSSHGLTIFGVSFLPSKETFRNTLNVNNSNLRFTQEKLIASIGFLEVLLNKLYKTLSCLLLLYRTTSAILITIRRITKIKQGCLAKVDRFIKYEIALQEQTEVRAKGLPYRLLTILNQEKKIQTNLAFLSHKDCKLMFEKVANYKDMPTSYELAEAYQVKLRREGKKQLTK